MVRPSESLASETEVIVADGLLAKPPAREDATNQARESALRRREKRMGRPSKYTDEVADKIIMNLEIGMSVHGACAQAGISMTTMYSWRDRNAVFDRRMATAEGEAEKRMMARVAIAAQKDWRPAAWWLERRRNADYGQKQVIAHTGEDGGPIQTQTESVVHVKHEVDQNELERAIASIRGESYSRDAVLEGNGLRQSLYPALPDPTAGSFSEPDA